MKRLVGSVALRGSLGIVAVAFALAGCETAGNSGKNSNGASGTAISAADAAYANRVIVSSFAARGQAGMDRVQQDDMQTACSAETPPSAAVTQAIEAREAQKIAPPPDGRYLGDWSEGEKLAQNGRGMTWSDPAESASGGNCYNCHQLSSKEIAFGTLGPPLYRYGKLRGVTDPASAQSAPIVQYTWGKLYDAKATNACSIMPRFGTRHILTVKQMQDLMALLLDPKSPVNE